MRKNVAGQRVVFSLFKNGARIANPTIAANDFTVALDVGAQNNVATLPTSDAAGKVIWLPAQAETNADTVTFLARDVAGDEWEPLTVMWDTHDSTVLAGVAAQFAAIPAAVWTYVAGGGRTLTSFGTLVADIWANATRSLTMSIEAIRSAASGNDIEIAAGDHMEWNIVHLGNITGWQKLWFTVKTSKSHADTQALIKIEEAVGLEIIAGATAATPLNGDITVNDAAAGDITITLTGEETVKLIENEGKAYYDIKWVDALDREFTLVRARALIVSDVTRETL